MAVSKHQNERPAITDLIDAVNMAEPIVAQNVQNIATLTQGLADEAETRAQAVQDEAEARQQAVQDEAEARQQAVQAEATARQQAVQAEATARAQAVQGVQNQIGEGIFSSAFTITQAFQRADVVLQNLSVAIDDINQWQDRFKFGLTSSVTVAAGSSTTGTLAFESPFGEDAEVAVFPVCVDASGNFTDLSCKLISADYSGFSFAVYNDTQASVTTKVGFLAAKVN